MAQKRHVFFALNGVTGAGKTTFASLASGRKHLKISNGKRSCTRKPQEVTFRFEGQVVTLIDTPGFGDPGRKDEDILEHIAKFLAERYGSGLFLDGLILFHPADFDMPRRAEKDLTEIVQRFLGKDVYDRVAIASTMWDSIPNHAQAQAVQQEHRRKQPGGVWHSMCSQGAVIFRHDNTKPSADTILRFLASRPNRPFPVLMQEELVSHNGHLASTSAGQEVNRRLDERILWAEQTRQNALLGCAERSLKRARELEKQLENFTNRRKKFDRIKILMGDFFAQLSLIFTPGQASSTGDPGSRLPASERSTSERSTSERSTSERSTSERLTSDRSTSQRDMAELAG